MKFTLSWLRAHLDTDRSLTELCGALNRIGLEVEGVENRGAALAPFRTARILSAEQHPNADRLRVCQVDAGLADTVQVVCGAPNARAGIAVIFAPPGSYVPGSAITIKAGEIRGQKSDGMLCSLRELGLGSEHDGIAELPDTTSPGQSYANYAGLDDPVIEIAITPNRGDALAVRGIARDLAAAGQGRLRPWLAQTVEGRFDSPVIWANDFLDACPWVLGRAIRGVRNGPSPAWLQERLTAVGLRPISALVDVTNFFSLDLGRPLHVFDVERLAGGALTLRRGRGETLRALDGRDYVTDAEDCVIADAAGVQSLAGLMGGEASGCTEATTDVFIECALFDPVRIALSGRRHGLHSDARQRFERGIDPALPVSALEAATRMIQELCGGEASNVVSAGEEPAWQRTASLRFARIAGLGGIDLPADEAVTVLEYLGFELQERDETQATFAVPSWRNDIAAPILLALPPDGGYDEMLSISAVQDVEAEADLIEEVLRLHGLDSIPPMVLPSLGAVPSASLTPRQTRNALARRLLASRGLAECVGFSFTDRTQAARFGETPDSLHLLNPIAADLDQMRPTPLVTLIQAARRNLARGTQDPALFEVGAGFDATGQRLIAAGVRTGRGVRHPGRQQTAVSLQDVKADLMALLSALGVPVEALSVTSDAPSHYHPGQSGVVRQGPKTVVGRFGVLHPGVMAELGLDGPAAAFELYLDAVADPKRRRKSAPNLSPLQPVRRDFAFLASEGITADAVVRAARGADRGLISGVSLFDIYAGVTLPPGTRSLAIEVVFQPHDRSLTDAELEAVSARVVAAVTKATGAVLRG
jgi:phenylalanyl-tRNA synthetase beta chain